MCGIVAYFGGAGNNLTRILTAMSAIIYRAPDSTGVGFLGDDVDPIRVRKSLGSVANLIPVLLDDPAYPNPAADLMSSLALEPGGASARELQRRLLVLEGFAPGDLGAPVNGAQPCPSYDDLVELDPTRARRMAPGIAGRPALADDLFIRSRKDFRKIIRHLVETYDFSLLVIQLLIRHCLAETLQHKRAAGALEIEPVDILAAFDHLFDRSILGERAPRPQRLTDRRFPRNPDVQKYLWRYLIETPVKIPADFDRDGVRCVFRLLDAALLSRLPHDSRLEEAFAEMLAKRWPQSAAKAAIDWKTLYKAEKAVNVYGWAAGAALAFLQQEEYFPELQKSASDSDRSKSPAAVDMGQTDPICLRYFASPVISQGRWSIQAPVTLQNAHPFFDERKQRLIALNGKFDTNLELELKEFLKHVAGVTFRSENSSEYLSLLWGYYYHQLAEEKRRCEIIKSQVEAGFERTHLGSQAIDYQLYHRVKSKTDVELDAMAFIEAARQIVRQGGQVAVTGMSLLSPRRIYIASHNRPIFVVRRLENDDFMVVSDINAAMGLFPHALIHQRTLALLKLRKEKNQALEELKTSGANKETLRKYELEFNQKEATLLEVFKVAVYPLVGEEIFARIATAFEGQTLRRDVTITDFDGKPLPDFEATLTVLRPPAIRDDLYRSYYESHLLEIPERMTEILDHYIPENIELPEFEVREDLFHRHFGAKLTTLKRIVLVGVGGAYNMATIARSYVRYLLPDMEVVVLMPSEVDELSKTIDADTDLAILLCWSATTADMVEFAKSLQIHKSVMIAITEKSFGDMALFGQKSGGIIPVLSGEEVTVTGIKSTLCMLFCLYLFVLWLAAQKGRRKAAINQLKKLHRLPEILSRMIADESLEAFSKHLASESAHSYAAVVLDALDTIGTGLEVASKLEEMSWTAMGSAIDYQDFQPGALRPDLNKNLVLINATAKARFPEALELMRTLYEKKLPFAAVTYSTRELAHIKRFTHNNLVCLPKMDDLLQPFIDLVFYYQFAFHYGLAHGRNAEDFPRNRVKSVTASRSSPWLTLSAAEELQLLKARNQIVTGAGIDRQPVSEENCWEFHSGFVWEKQYYAEMRHLSEVIRSPDPLGGLMDISAEDSTSLGNIISTIISSEGEILFVPLDRIASAAVRNVVANLRRVLGCTLRVASKNFIPAALSKKSLSVLVAAKRPDEAFLLKVRQKEASPYLWVGWDSTKSLLPIVQRSGVYCRLKGLFRYNRADVLYAGLLLLLVRSWSRIQPSKAETLQNHLMQIGSVTDSLLIDVALKNALAQTMAANRSYRTAFFLGPPAGAGLFWSEIFKKAGSLILKANLFGESVHGPIVTVDSKVEGKFVKLENRKQMVTIYGKKHILQWEQGFLNGTEIDNFLSRPLDQQSTGSHKPFFAEGSWYLPVLRNGYNSAQDNLIIVDATSERYFAQAIDELATFGCRYARMIVLTQEAFRKDADKKVLYQYPISHLIELPAIRAKNGEAIPVSEFLLPLALNLVGVATAAAAVEK